MTQEELNQARTNPEFINYLEETRVDAIKTKNISALYEVLDSLLILDLDEEKINSVYESILKISFENVEQIVNTGAKLKLEGDEHFYVRSFYEHAIEKWSYDDVEGAKELFFVLSHIIDDQKLTDALNVHLIACSKNYNLDSFYDNMVDTTSTDVEEVYGYFIVHFKEDTQQYLKENEVTLKVLYNNLKHLLD